MPTEQVWLYEHRYEMLKFLVDFYEEQQDKEFNGKAFNWSSFGGKRERRDRKEINYSYVIRIAIQELYDQVESHVEKEKNELESKAKMMTAGRRFGFGARNQTSQTNTETEKPFSSGSRKKLFGKKNQGIF